VKGLKFDILKVQVDRVGATAQRCNEVESQIFDLFAQMGATDDQLDFPVLYASGRQVGSWPILRLF
jgi:GTP-binding protein